jgi:hypothetical protein
MWVALATGLEDGVAVATMSAVLHRDHLSHASDIVNPHTVIRPKEEDSATVTVDSFLSDTQRRRRRWADVGDECTAAWSRNQVLEGLATTSTGKARPCRAIVPPFTALVKSKQATFVNGRRSKSQYSRHKQIARAERDPFRPRRVGTATSPSSLSRTPPP